MSDYVWWDGGLVPAEAASVPVQSAGVLLGVMPYETLRVHRGQPLHVTAHLDRFDRSCSAVGIPTLPRSECREAVETMAGEGPEEGLLRLASVPGGAASGYEIETGEVPELLVTSRPLPERPEPGVRAVTAPFEAIPPRAWPHSAKLTGRTANVVARNHARALGAHEALFQSQHAGYTEGTSTNLFVVHGDHLVTAPDDHGILPGLTREWLLSEARSMGLVIHEVRVTYRDLRTADEVFLTGTGWGVVPVVKLDGYTVGGGAEGHVVGRVREAYEAHLADAAGPVEVPPAADE